MKRIILLIMLTLFSLSISAQGIITIVQTELTSKISFNRKSQEWGDFEKWDECDLKISLDSSRVIRLNNRRNDYYTLTEYVETNYGINELTNDYYDESLYEATDNKGRFLYLRMKEYSSGRFNISLYYRKRAYTFKGSKLGI